MEPQPFSDESLSSFLELTGDGVIAFDASRACRFMSKRAAELLGVARHDCLGRSFEGVMELFALSIEQPRDLLRMARADWTASAATLPLRVAVLRPVVRDTLWTILRTGASKDGTLVIVQELMHARRGESRSTLPPATASRIDALTGLPNGRLFQDEIDREHSRSTRARESFTVLLVDVDALRVINDRFGHAVGDDVMNGVAACLRGSRREYDVLGRLDDDEFGALLPGASRDASRVVAERVQATVARFDYGNAALTVTVSIGGAVWEPSSGADRTELLTKARAALAAAKALGRGRIEVALA